LTYTPLDNSLLFLLAGLTAALRPVAETSLAEADTTPSSGRCAGAIRVA
jgi:hypothetical protein